MKTTEPLQPVCSCKRKMVAVGGEVLTLFNGSVLTTTNWQCPVCKCYRSTSLRKPPVGGRKEYEV